MGDSMNQARAFMRNCQTALFDMAASDKSVSALDLSDPARLNTDVCVSALTAIQTGAKLNHALAIYRAAQQALNVIDNPALLGGRIERLSYLVSQYETGLLELEVEQAKTEPSDAGSAVIANDSNIDGPSKKVYYLSGEERQARAQRALKGAINLANQSERSALETLLSQAQPPTPEDAKESQEEAEASIDVVASSERKSMPTPKARQVALDNLVQDIIQFSLTVARQHGLTLSLSYDMGEETIAEVESERFKMRICQWMTYLIRHIAASQTAAALAESMAHIDIAATPEHISLSTIAANLPVSSEATLPEPQTVRPSYEAETNRLTLALTYRADRPRKESLSQAQKPQLKMPVDEGIASRLEALLAGNTHLIALEPKRAAS